VAVVISDFFDHKGYTQAMNYLRYHKYEIYAIHLLDEKEANPHLRGDVDLIDCETGQSISTTVSPRMLKAYRKAFQDYCNELEEFCLRSEIALFRAPVQAPFEDLIMDIFRRGGFLR
jgi:hypothetical protein